MTYPLLTLKAGRENAPANRHPWIFSGALAEGKPEVPHGALVRVAEASGQVIATGTYSAKGMIAVRVLAWEEAPITREWIRERVREAVERRRLVGIGADETVTGYRAVFGEADGLPGLVVDRYGEVAVVQFATAGAEGLREPILQALADVLTPAAIYERSDLPARTEEGLAPASGLLSGVLPERVEFAEHGLRFTADVTGGQKTGFFLDQRDVRRQARALAAGRRVADLFSYRGAAGVAALKGGAEHVHCVDSSAAALAAVGPEAEANGLAAARITAEEADVFQWLGQRSEPEFDMVLLDPPALIKSRRHAEEGRKGYHFLNRAALRILRDQGLLVTSSCSFFFTEDDFATTLRRAAAQAGVQLHVLATVRQAADHPVALHFPESFYLKSFVCQVRRRV